MHIIDYSIFGVYFLGILSVGIYFYNKNESKQDYYVGGRKISAGHIGLSIVATDVGGGFSIGLGGLGFTMGLSGSWLLFTGLVGAWLAAVLIVPKLKKMDNEHGLLTYPEFLSKKYSSKVALFAAFISGIGYLGFTAAQILAGAKLAAGSVFSDISFMSPLSFSLYLMAAVIILYTVLGGIKAVIYTDTIQWTVLLAGLFFVALPIAYSSVGGWEQIKASLPEEFFSLGNIEPVTFFNWFVTILPIWFIAMTLYQRVFSSKNVKEAKKAFFIAGLFEYPVMAFIGVVLGMLSRISFANADPEMGLPLFLNAILPIGATGIVLAAYFSAVMSTADSCLIASSGNFVNDILERTFLKGKSTKEIIRYSQLVTLLLGLIALLLAGYFGSVLDLILNAYGFMVSGLFIPTLFAYFSKSPNSKAAGISMIGGGSVTLFLIFIGINLPFGIDATFWGIITSLILYLIFSKSGHQNAVR